MALSTKVKRMGKISGFWCGGWGMVKVDPEAGRGPDPHNSLDVETACKRCYRRGGGMAM